MTRSTRASLVLLTLLIAGCGSVPRNAGFDDVHQDVSRRTGMRVHWNQGTGADAAVETQVREMLGRGELSADEAVQIALLNNRRLQATYEDLMVAQADLVAAGLLANPIFEAEVTFPEGGGGAGLEFTVVQEFLSVFQIPLRRRIARAGFEAAKLRVSGAVIDLAADVREAHVDYVAAEQFLEMRRTIASAAELAFELAQRIREAGNITALTLDIERAQYEQARLSVAAAEYDVIARRERLNVLMGLRGQEAQLWRTPARLPEIRAELSAGATQPAEATTQAQHMPAAQPATQPAAAAQTTAELEQTAVENSLELAAIRHDIEGAWRALGLQRTRGLLPSAEAGAKAERESEGHWAAGPVIELPIPLFSQGQPQVAAAAAELRRAQATYQATETELRSSVRASAALVENARSRVRHYQEVILPLRARILEQTQLEYNAMITGAFELLQARQQQIEAGGQYIEALREYWIARNALDTVLAGRMRGVSTDDSRATIPAGAGRDAVGH